MPSKKIFTDRKYLLPLKSYGNFHKSVYLASTTKQTLEMKKTTGEDYFYGNFHKSVYLASTTKQTLEMKKTTGEDYFYLPYRALWYKNA